MKLQCDVTNVIILITTLFALIECNCDFLRNVEFTAITKYSGNVEVAVSNCKNSRIFSEDVIKGLYIQNQSIINIPNNSISNMEHLEAVSFNGCNIETVEAGAFSNNVPVLSEIFIVKSYIQEIPKGVFNNLPSVRKIRLDNNRIQIIQKYAFANNIALKKIDVSNNKLKYWDRDWFEKSKGIEKINFEFNLIEKIPKSAFKIFTNLTSINFNYNNISYIEPKAFQGIHRLKYLGLRYNRLTTLQPTIFHNKVHIDSLFIDANKFNYIPTVTLFRMSVNNVTLDGNPWSCSCLANVGLWLRLIDGRVKFSKYCKGLDILQCVHVENTKYCNEAVNEELTQTYYNSVKSHLMQKKIVNDYCVRLD